MFLHFYVTIKVRYAYAALTVFFSFYYRIRLFWKNWNDTAIKRVYTSIKGDTPGKPNNETQNFTFEEFNMKSNFVLESWNITKGIKIQRFLQT
jgi:hypothetical protein